MSIRAGKAIFGMLRADEALSSKVGDRIFPIVALDDTTYPYIAYRRKNLIPAYTKDRHSVEDSIFVDVVIVGDSYEDTLTIGMDVLRVLDRKRGLHYGIDINDIRLSDSEEEAAEVYMQRLEFEILINTLK